MIYPIHGYGPTYAPVERYQPIASSGGFGFSDHFSSQRGVRWSDSPFGSHAFINRNANGGLSLNSFGETATLGRGWVPTYMSPHQITARNYLTGNTITLNGFEGQNLLSQVRFADRGAGRSAHFLTRRGSYGRFAPPWAWGGPHFYGRSRGARAARQNYDIRNQRANISNLVSRINHTSGLGPNRASLLGDLSSARAELSRASADVRRGHLGAASDHRFEARVITSNVRNYLNYA